MRHAMSRIKDFSLGERKLESIQYMTEIVEKHKCFRALVQWVRVAYDVRLDTEEVLRSRTSSLI